MKFKSSYIFKALTALVLALLMVFGTVATSMAAVVDDLADSGVNADIAQSGWNTNSLSFGGYLKSDKSGYSSSWNTISMDGNGSNYYYMWAIVEKNTTVQFGFTDQWNQFIKGGTKTTSNATNSTTGITRNYWSGMSMSGSNASFSTPNSTYAKYIVVIQCWTDSWNARVDMIPYTDSTVKVHYQDQYGSYHKYLYAWQTYHGGSSYSATNALTNYTNSVGNRELNGAYGSVPQDTRAAEGVTGYTQDWNTHDLSYYDYPSNYGVFYLKMKDGSGASKDLTINRSDVSGKSEIWVYNASNSNDTIVVTDRVALRELINDTDIIDAYNSGTNPGYTSASYSAFKTAYEDAATKFSAYASTQAQIDAALTAMQNAYDSLVIASTPNLNAISNVSKTVNDTTFNVTGTIENAGSASGTLSATATSGTTSVATVGTPTVSGSTVTIPVTVKGPGSSSVSVTLKDGATMMNSQSFSVDVATPTFSIAAPSSFDVTSKNAALTVTQSPAPSSGISYSSNKTSYVTVNASGQVTAAAVPTSNQTATITATATYGCGYTKDATASVTLKAPTLVAKSSKTSGYINDTATASVNSSSYPAVSSSTVSAYKWTTSDSSIIGISDATAAAPTLTFKKNGTATIKLEVTYKNTGLKKESANVSITVNAPSISVTGGTSFDVAKGEKKTLAATTSNPSGLTIKYSQSAAVTGFSVTEAGVVSVGNNAATNATYTVVATAYNSDNVAVKTQNITIKAVAPDYQIKNGDETLTSTSTVYMTTGGTKQLTLDKNYTGTFTFSSSDTSIVTVSDEGLLTAGSKKGTATITVTSTRNNPVNTVTGFIRGIFGLAESGLAPNETLTFNVNVTEADTYKYLYFTDGVGWSGVKAYLYGDGSNASFPGEAMVKIGKNEENKDVYAIRYPATKNYTKVIISNSADNSKRVQLSGSSDLTLSSTQNAFWCNTANNDSGAGRWNCTIVKPQITANNVTIDMGSTQTMTATVLTSGTPSTFNWSSGSASVATTADTHTASNVITGVAPGNSTITIKAYAEKPSGWNSIVTDGTADDYVAGTTTATATVVAENKTVTFGAKKTDNGSDFSDLSGAVTAKYYDEDTSSGSGSSGGSGTATNYKVLYGDQTALGSTSNATVYLVDGSYVANLSSDTTFLNALNSHTSNFYIAMSSSSSPSDIISITNANSVTLSGNMASAYGKDAQQRDFSGTKLFARIWRSGSTNVAGFKFTQSGSSYAFEISSSAISDGGSGSGSSGGESGGESSGTGYTGEGTTMTSPQSVPYGKIAVFTAQATYISGSDTYAFAEWVDGSNNTLSTDLEYAVKITEAKSVYARYYKVFKLSAFDSYTSDGTNVTFATAPPKLITIKHGDDTYIYSYDGTAATGNPDSPAGDTASDKADPLDIESGTYGQGNYIQYYAGDEITLYYSAMASSEIFKGVFYNNSENYFVKKPDAGQFVPHDYSTGKTLYMNSAYYENVPSGLPTTTVDHDAHSIKFTGTQDYKNIDIEVGTKRKVYFSDYTNAIIGSKNTDDYYYDGEALSVTGDQLTVKAAGSATQTNSIDKDAVKIYRADANGKSTGSPLSGFTVTYDSGTDPVSNSGATASTRYIIISGNMPAYDLYIDLGMTNSYTIKLGNKIISDDLAHKTRLADEVAAITITGGADTLTATNSADVTSSTSVATGTTLSLSSAFNGGWGDYYMFVGWYWGDDTAPDYKKGFISDKDSLNYTPKKGGTIWAVGTRSIYINGSKYITGKDTDWYSENNTWKNQKMSFDPSRGTQGSYYWEITDTMFASAGSNFKTWKTNWNNWDEKTTDYGIYKLSEGNYYWTDNNDSYHGKSYFQFLDNATGNDSKSVWSQIYSFEESQEGATYGKAYMRDEPNDESKRWNGQGFINFNETDYSGYSSPIRIYLDADTKALDVRPTPIYSNLYVSNGYNVGSTLKSDAVTVQPVVDGAVKTSGQTGYFVVKTEGNGWTQLNHEGTVKHYIPQKKGATVRITKEARGSDKIAAFLIYDIDNKTVRAERNLTKGTTANSKTPYYFDLTLANERQNLYIVPIVEEANSKVTITFDATQLNRAQWGDIVSAYSWYKSGNAPGLGDYPGQPMIPSDDMSTWTASFPVTKNGSELAGITFSNYVDSENGHGHSWLGEPGVLGTVNDHKTGAAEGGIINVYNHVDSGTNGEFSRTNYKAQTYDYHEPIALYNRYKGEQSVNITFQMKDGNSSLISWRHTEFDDNNILNLPPQWGKLNWEYLTNAKGDQYIDMNGKPMGENNKPTASFYVAAKGQVIYQDSKMNYVFHGGHDYQMKGYAGTYNNGTYSRSALSAWNSDITYYGANGLNMSYAVQWYVYDASGNYITTVLSAGIADLSSNNTDTYIAKQLEDLGYAVDGKSVAICYDKPRYMYSDSTVTNSANNINSGTDFNAYRFEGQWIAAAHTDTVKVNVEVAMMTDSGEVLAKSNTAGYGNATAALYFSDKNNYGLPGYATSANDGSWAQTAATDAKLNGIVLNASSQNFQGWYYYDANTGDFTKASYASNVGFRPNYSNKDVTYYAVYRASAIYQYKYTGREGERTYSASGEDLTAAEMGAHNVINPASHETDIKNKVPVGIGIFKKNIDFSPTNYNNWNKTADPNGYILDITGFNVDELPTYTLTAHYKNANGDLISISKTATYNTTPVDLTTEAYTTSDNSTKAAGTAPTTYYGQRFLGWYSYDGSTAGNLISTQANYGLRLTGNQSIIAVYDENSNALPNDGWNAEIDENEYNKELTTSDSGVYYNDTIVRIRYGSDVKATLPSGGRVGVIVIRDNKVTTASTAINGYNSTQLTQIANAVASGNTAKLKNGYSVTNLSTTNVTQFNRSDLAARSDYKNSLGSKYTVYAYVYDGSAYHFSAPSTVKTFE